MNEIGFIVLLIAVVMVGVLIIGKDSDFWDSNDE